MKKDNMAMVYSIAELSQLFEKHSNIQGFLQKVVVMVSDHMKADVCSIYLYEKNSSLLRLKATIGLAESSIDNVVLKIGEGITGQSLKELRPICVGCASKSPNFKFFENINEEEYEAFLAVPIVHGLNKIGVMVLQHKKKNYFQDEDIIAVKTISSQLAASLENAQLLLELNDNKPEIKETGIDLPSFIKGQSASEGIAIGKAISINTVSIFKIDKKEKYDESLSAFKKALKKTINEIKDLQQQMEDKLFDIGSLIFSSHLLMLNDDAFTGAMIEKIESDSPASEAVIEVVKKYIKIFSKSENALVREKVHDLNDIGHRLLRNLSKKHYKLGDYSNQILVAKNLMPSDLIKISAQKPEGFILYGSSLTSHVAILSRSLDLPVIFTDNEDILSIEDNTKIIIDAYQGNIFINPDENIKDKYKLLHEQYKNLNSNFNFSYTKCRTKDNQRIKILANINLLSDVKLANKVNAEGIGLYRSEFPFIIRNDFPSEEEQYRIYKSLIDQMEGKEVVFRTLDIGGDKMLSYLPNKDVSNPFLGLRAIRFTLKNKDIFKNQLKAMLRAGADRELKILLPLISSVDDFIESQKIVKICIAELKKSKIKHNPKPLLGTMIELPSAIELADELAEISDFLSIGTNDLIQYLLGIDRTNEDVSNYYLPHHPSVFRALKRIADAAIKHNCEISVCGNAATNQAIVKYLIGIGIKKLSMSPHKIPEVIEFISKIDSKKAKSFSRNILSKKTINEITETLK